MILDRGHGSGKVDKQCSSSDVSCGGAALNKEPDFRLWHSGWQGKGSLNKEVDSRSWHCGRQGGEKFK